MTLRRKLKELRRCANKLNEDVLMSKFYAEKVQTGFDAYVMGFIDAFDIVDTFLKHYKINPDIK